MKKKFGDWMAIGGLLLLGALAAAGWSGHTKPAPEMRATVQQQATSRTDSAARGPIRELSRGAAGFVK